MGPTGPLGVRDVADTVELEPRLAKPGLVRLAGPSGVRVAGVFAAESEELPPGSITATASPPSRTASSSARWEATQAANFGSSTSSGRVSGRHETATTRSCPAARSALRLVRKLPSI